MTDSAMMIFHSPMPHSAPIAAVIQTAARSGQAVDFFICLIADDDACTNEADASHYALDQEPAAALRRLRRVRFLSVCDCH
jgi:hypothetical protein